MEQKHQLAKGFQEKKEGGFEIRDCIGYAWVYGSGFPKSHDISKGIDKRLGEEREIVGTRVSAYGTETSTGERVSREKGGAGLWAGSAPKEVVLTGNPATAAAQTWDGYGTALKPAWEPIVLAMNPLDGTFAKNALKHGVAGLNIDATRISHNEEIHVPQSSPARRKGVVGSDLGFSNNDSNKFQAAQRKSVQRTQNLGRWPANLILEESDEIAGMFPDSNGQQGDVSGTEPSSPIKNVYGNYNRVSTEKRGDSGSAVRFFYQAKSSRRERNAGCLQPNKHPTLKPIELTKYLATMILPPYTGRPRRILVPFCGSGSEMIGAMLAG